MVIDVPFDQIDKKTIDRLIEDKVSEGKVIEYKLKLPCGRDGDKREFLGDVSSFANAAGGHILYGMEEDEGKPVAAPGLDGINPDAKTLRLEQSIRTGIDPCIPGVHTKDIPGSKKVRSSP